MPVTSPRVPLAIPDEPVTASRKAKRGPREIRLDCGRLRLAGRDWGNPEGQPILALHGWLDNAATFDRLLPHFDLERFRVVALDLPGHGRSQHRRAGEIYHLLDNLVDILGAVRALGWQQFILLGHSLGGVLSMLFASAYPELIQKLVVIDAMGPLVNRDDETPGQLRKALDRYFKGHSPMPVYGDMAAAVAARQQGIGDLSASAAAIIARRNLKKVAGGYSWRTDPRLRWPSLARMSEPQVQACLGSIANATLIIGGTEGFLNPDSPLVQSRLAQIRNLTFKQAQGGHHLHLEPHPAGVADLVMEFLSDSPGVG